MACTKGDRFASAMISLALDEVHATAAVSPAAPGAGRCRARSLVLALVGECPPVDRMLAQRVLVNV